MKVASGFISKSRMCDTPGNIGERIAAINPMIVIGATTGSARTFAGIETSENRPEIARIIGVHMIVAESGIAISGENFSSFGANNKMPAVAATESAKPGSIA
jgi:hypothetical protein